MLLRLQMQRLAPEPPGVLGLGPVLLGAVETGLCCPCCHVLQALLL